MKQTVYTLKKFSSAKRFIVLLLCISISFFSYSQSIPPRPNPPRLVNDLANVLSTEQEQILEQKLVALDDSTSNQIAILLVQSLNGDALEDYSLKVLRDWGIGSKKHNNGILIFAAIEDHKVRIEVGFGLEGAVSDIIANNIIENDIVPAFKQENYYQGLNAATDDLIKAAAGEYHDVRQRSDDNGGSGGGSILGIIIIIIVIIIIIRRGGGRGGGGMVSRRGYGGLGPFILGNIIGSSLGGGSRGGWGDNGGGGWSSGGGGGGFGGFGGGSGGGGGASGSW